MSIGSLASLIDENLVGVVTAKFTEIVAATFEKGHPRTQDEVRRRFTITLKWFKIMRGDLKWTLVRIFDSLPDALKAELNGSDYTPDMRKVWIPSDGSV